MSSPLQAVTPREYFKEKVDDALTNQNVEIDDTIQFYLVNLLCDFVSLSKLHSTGHEKVLDTPLALMLKEAMESPPGTRVKILKRLGDTSLYFAGFFQEFFTRKTFDIDYYISMGANAYDNVSQLMRDHFGEDHFQCMYRQLSTKFGSLVEVVAEVSDNKEGAENHDLINLYDRFTRSPSERLLRILEQHGIIPVVAPKTSQ